MQFVISDQRGSETDDLIAGVRAFNEATAGPANAKPLVVVARGDDGALLGGVSGRTAYGHFLIEVVWVAESRRGTNLGRRLMEAAEAEARERGCVAAQVDTLSFQAPGFYRKLGFEPIARIADFPPGHERYYLLKRYRREESHGVR